MGSARLLAGTCNAKLNPVIEAQQVIMLLLETMLSNIWNI